MLTHPATQHIELWLIERLVEYPRNPRKNDAAVDRMCGSIREFGFKIPCLVRGDGEVVDGHLRLKAARKLGITEIPVILCDEWTPAQVKAFRLMVNRSVTWADWDEELLALELQEIQESDFDLSLTGFNPGEIDALLALDDEEKANATPPLPESPVSRPGDLWLLGPRTGLALSTNPAPGPAGNNVVFAFTADRDHPPYHGWVFSYNISTLRQSGNIGLRLEAGRWFTSRDLQPSETSHALVAVNRTFVRKFFPNEDPLGKILLDGDKKISSEIVSVVSDYRAMGAENGNRPTIFHLTLQVPKATLLVRAGGPLALAAALRNAVWSQDRTLPAVDVLPMEYYVDQSLSQRRFNTLLLEVFAGLALVLGMLGIYGVLSNLVASRIREIGIRMAVGASPAAIGKLVLRQSLVPIAAGLAVGLAGSLVVGRFLETLLFQVHPRDPLIIALASSTVLMISPAALYLPLRRATRVDCTVALREE